MITPASTREPIPFSGVLEARPGLGNFLRRPGIVPHAAVLPVAEDAGKSRLNGNGAGKRAAPCVRVFYGVAPGKGLVAVVEVND